MELFEILPFAVYEVLDVGVKVGITTESMHNLACAFKTREKAEDYVEYQATIDRYVKYTIKEFKK